MPGQNNFVPWATGAGANVYTPASYIGNAVRQTGVVEGEADPLLANNAWRQASSIAAMLGQFIADNGFDALDNGDLAALETNFRSALNASLQSNLYGATALWHSGTASGSATIITVPTVTPTVTAYQNSLPVLVTMPFTNGANATINIAGLGAVNLLRNDGTPIVSGDAPSGSKMLIAYDGVAFRLVGFGRVEVPRISSSATLYVRPDGSDANDGSANDAAHAFQTPQAAINRGAAGLYLAGQSLIIQLGTPGNYTPPATTPAGSGPIIIRGDINNQGGYILAGPGPAGSGNAVISSGSSLTIQGVTIQNTGSTNHTLGASAGGSVNVSYVTFDNTASSTWAHCIAFGGTMTIGAGVIHKGSAGYMWLGNGGTVTMAANVTMQGTPNFSIATVMATVNGSILLANAYNFAGTATGVRYNAYLNGVINTGGAGPNFFPGSTAGTASMGGQYA